MLNNYVKLHVNPALWDKDAAYMLHRSRGNHLRKLNKIKKKEKYHQCTMYNEKSKTGLFFPVKLCFISEKQSRCIKKMPVHLYLNISSIKEDTGLSMHSHHFFFFTYIEEKTTHLRIKCKKTIHLVTVGNRGHCNWR